MGLQKAESFYENTDLDFDVILLTKDNQIYISEELHRILPRITP